MITLILAMAAAPVQPNAAVMRPAPLQPAVAAATLTSRKQHMIADARALVARAERVSAAAKPGPGAPTKAELDASVDQMKSDLDSMSEMSEEQSLRLQMAMDRVSKTMETLSNMLKKMSDTAEGITQNIK
jgi:methylthioribose-1-phosphate isomerase